MHEPAAPVTAADSTIVEEPPATSADWRRWSALWFVAHFAVWAAIELVGLLPDDCDRAALPAFLLIAIVLIAAFADLGTYVWLLIVLPARKACYMAVTYPVVLALVVFATVSALGSGGCVIYD